jgi:tetratricopeptide (TPR) repeat protein
LKRSILCIAGILLLGSVRTWAGGTIPVRLVGGRLCARCTLSAGQDNVTAQFVINLGGAYGVVLDQDACTILSLAPDAVVTLDFQSQGKLADQAYRKADLGNLKEFTTRYATELEEIPVWGMVGLTAFGEAGIRLDIREGRLIFGPMADADDAWHTIRYTDASGQYRTTIEPMADYKLRAGFTTASYETRIDGICAALAERPGGNFDRCTLGTLNLSEYTAIRPVEGLSEQLVECDAIIGNSFWQDFVIQIDPLQKAIRLQAKLDRQSDLGEQQYFMAFAEDDVEGMEQYLAAHPQSRLAREASLTVLTRRVQDPSASADSLQQAARSLRQTVPPKEASAELLALADTLSSGSDDRLDHVALLLEQASQCAQQTTDAALIARDIEVRRGSLSLAKGDLKEARVHLLSALFGQPDNPLYNYWMGRYYEAKDQKVRAWSRYLRAGMGDKPVSEAIAALERLTNDPNLRQDFSVQDAQDFLEGHIPAYSPADLAGRWRHPPDTLVEALMCADNAKTTAVNLALRALAEEGVLVLCYHINAPDPDPLANAATVEVAKRLGIESTPTVLLNGRAVPLTEQDLSDPNRVLTALTRAEAGTTLQHVAVEIEPAPEEKREIAVVWPDALEADVNRADVFCVESAVLLNSANQCWLHGPVVRGQLSQNDLQRTPGRLAGILDPQAVLAEQEAFAHRIESELGITYRTIPTYIDVRRCSVLVKLYDRDGNVLAVGTAPL